MAMPCSVKHFMDLISRSNMQPRKPHNLFTSKIWHYTVVPLSGEGLLECLKIIVAIVKNTNCSIFKQAMHCQGHHTVAHYRALYKLHPLYYHSTTVRVRL